MNKAFDIPLIYSEKRILSEIPIQYYFCYNNSFPSGRPNDTEEIELETFKQYVDRNRNDGKVLNYLLNGNIGSLNVDSFKKYFSWIINDIQPNIITFSDPRVYHYLKSNFDFHHFEISAISGIQSEQTFRDFVRQNEINITDINKIVLHHDFTREFNGSLEFVSYLKRHSISPCVLVTESCYYKCPFRQAHYTSLLGAYKNPNKVFRDYFQINCVIERLLHPESLLNLVGFLLPEQLDVFSYHSGIENFKISGRSKSADWIYNTAQAYLSCQTPNNTFDIIVFTTPFLSDLEMNLGNLFYLNSRAYLNICAEQKEIKDISILRAFLKDKSVSLFLDGHLRINDPNSLYGVKDGELVVLRKGEYLKLLESQLIDSKQHKINPIVKLV